MTITNNQMPLFASTTASQTFQVGKLGGFSATIWSGSDGNSNTERTTLVDLDNDARKRPDVKIIERNGRVSVFEVQRNADGTEKWVESEKYSGLASAKFKTTTAEQYTVVRGDNLGKIARIHGVSVNELRKANNIPENSSLIKPGQILVIPVKLHTITDNLNYSESEDVNLSSAKNVDITATSPAIETTRTPQMVNVEVSSSGESTVVLTQPPTSRTRTILKGETLEDIVKEERDFQFSMITSLDEAIAFVGDSITTEDLKRVNNIVDDKKIRANTELTVPSKTTETFSEKEQRILTIAANYAKKMEGFHDGEPYTCPAGKLTIGYGHVITANDHEILRTASKLTEKQAQTLLENDMKKSLVELRNLLGNQVMSKLSDEQVAALTSYMFNVGTENFSAKSKLAKNLKKGNYVAAQVEMDVVTSNDGKKILPGLITRRAQEMLLFGEGSLREDAQNRILKALKRLYGYKDKAAALEGLKKDNNMQELYKLLLNPSSYYAQLKSSINPTILASI